MKTMINILIIGLYCFPFAYFSMYQDFANYSMLGYLLMITATSVLAFICRFFNNSFPLLIGNILSGIISFYFTGEMSGNERWGGYFKPFSDYQLLVFVILFNIIPQCIVYKITGRFKK
ncbi:hypothetical protein [Mesobacillus zeae]|uniref:Uncharacterized protein n=1 Tax=Mesobacillus zeae TaxID=1917180 RepID=A0A398BCI8_9BACI|nr:hypothetical protein [Mesobacillus zeae]RID87527.1 hypothetical protein D1970_04990 [Mesobacillus zeae]